MRQALVSRKAFFSVAGVILFLLPACTLPQPAGTGARRPHPLDTAGFAAGVRFQQGDATLHYRLGCYLQERGRHKPAIEAFKEALSIDSNYAKAYNAMGVSYDFLADYQKAAAAYAKALRIDPRLDYVVNNLGYSYYLQGKMDLAIEYLQLAVDLDDRNARYLNNLGLALVRSGRGAEAEVHFEKAAALRSGGRQATEQAIARFKIAEPETRNVTSASAATTRGDNPQVAAAPPAEVPDPDPYADLDAQQSRQLSLLKGDGLENLDAKRVRIEVSNGNGVRRMASRVGHYLQGSEVALMYLSNAPHFNYPETTIYYVHGYLPEAYRLARRLPGRQRLEEVPEIRQGHAQVSILIGRDLVPHVSRFDQS